MCIIKTKEDHHIQNTIPLFQRLGFPLEQYVSIKPADLKLTISLNQITQLYH